MICTSIASLSYPEIKAKLSSCEMIELRLDKLELSPEQIHELIHSSPVPVLVTYRPGKIPEAERVNLLVAAVESGAEYIDVEIESPLPTKRQLHMACKGKAKLVISYHDYERTPVGYELQNIVQRCMDDGADIAKVACMVNSKKDAARILGLYAHFGSLVALGMGQLGRITRISAQHLGAPFTYASVDQMHKTAPGQLSADELKQIYRILES